MADNLIITGGIFHPFEDSSKALAEALGEAGLTSDTTLDVDKGLQSLAEGAYRMVTVNALRWGMMTADKYAAYREQWAYQMPVDSRNALSNFVDGGGALLGLHTASICFDDWPEWGALLGGQWRWGESHHPPLGRVSVTLTAEEHDLTRGVAPFELVDEVYHRLALQPDIVPLAEAQSAEGGDVQPVVWARRYGSGRVVYDALGHDAASVNQPQHRRLLMQAAEWLMAKA